MKKLFLSLLLLLPMIAVAQKSPVFSAVDQMPEFPGGPQALNQYLSENVRYPVIAQENGIHGRAVCRYTIEIDGSITNVEIVRSTGDPSLDKEAVRVIRSMPKWKPGKHNGMLVRVCMLIPISFTLEDSEVQSDDLFIDVQILADEEETEKEKAAKARVTALKESAVEADSASSALFSKQFVLPDRYGMNAFDVIVGDTIIINAPVANYTSVDDSDLVRALKTWQDTSSLTLKKGVTLIHYSPVFYANTNDTLYCDAELQNQNNSYGEKAAMFYRFIVRNHRKTPYYMIAYCHKNKRSLHVYERGTDKPFMIEKDIAYSPLYVVKDGMQIYLTETGKVSMRQMCHLDTLKYAEEMDERGLVAARYTFDPQSKTSDLYWIKKKEVFYPSGAVQMLSQFNVLEIRTYAFNEDGTEAKLKPVSYQTIDNVFRKYFKQHFKTPDIGRVRYGISEMMLKVELAGTISEKGEMIVAQTTKRSMESDSEKNTDNSLESVVLDYLMNSFGKGEMNTSDALGRFVRWTYKYDLKVITDGQIREIIQKYYVPFLTEFLNELTHTTLTCAPAKVNNEPVSSPFVIKFAYPFKP